MAEKTRISDRIAAVVGVVVLLGLLAVILVAFLNFLWLLSFPAPV